MLFKPSFWVGFGAGFGAGFFSRDVFGAEQLGMRPTAKAILRGAYLAVGKMRESLAMAGETFEDLVAEVKSEIAAPIAGTAKTKTEEGSEAAAEPTETHAVKVRSANEESTSERKEKPAKARAQER